MFQVCQHGRKQSDIIAEYRKGACAGAEGGYSKEEYKKTRPQVRLPLGEHRLDAARCRLTEKYWIYCTLYALVHTWDSSAEPD